MREDKCLFFSKKYGYMVFINLCAGKCALYMRNEDAAIRHAMTQMLRFKTWIDLSILKLFSRFKKI